MDDSAPWKTEETIIVFSQLPVLSELSRFCGCYISPYLCELSRFGGCHLSPSYVNYPDLVAVTFHLRGGCHLSPSHLRPSSRLELFFRSPARSQRRRFKPRLPRVPLNQGGPPCSSAAWPPGPRQGWAAGSDRFWLLELRVSRTFLDQVRKRISFKALRLGFRLVASDFPGIVCILDGKRAGAGEFIGLAP